MNILLFLISSLLVVNATSTLIDVAGVKVETDSNLPFSIARPEGLSLVSSGKVSIQDLIKIGGRNWYTVTPFDDMPFAIPRELVKPRDLLPLPLRIFGRFGVSLANYSYPLPFPYAHGALLGISTYRNSHGHLAATFNCANCHTGQVNGQLIPGLGNKYYDEGQTFRSAHSLLRSGLKSRNPIITAESAYYLEKFSNYRKLLFTNCNQNPRLGTHTGTRIEQVGSGYLTSPTQFNDPDSARKYPCGGIVKVQPLNILKFKNLAFSDGKLNSTWNSRWPILTLLEKSETIVDELAERADIQALDSYVYFGTKSPSWKEIMRTPINLKATEAGFKLFHQKNSCVSCHGTYSPDGMLTHYKVQVIPLSEIGTSPDRTAENLPEIQQAYYKNGPGPKFFEPVQGVGYVANPLCSTFLNYPYLHTGGVANLFELLKPEELRTGHYFVGDFVDKFRVGFSTRVTAKIARLMKGKILLKQHISRSDLSGHSGERFGTELKWVDRLNLIEYLKTLRCPEGP